MKFKTGFFFFISLFLLHSNAFSQLAISNGMSLPPTDTTRVLVVFAQVDYSTGGCPQNLPDNINGQWPVNDKGIVQLPDGADTYFDFEIKNGVEPKGYVTKLYYEASFGKYVLLGDYYPEVITVPCNKISIGNEGLDWVLDSLNNKKTKDTTLYSYHGLPLNSFDKWTITQDGMPKVKKPDGSIDLLFIIWRNNRFIYTANTKDNSGYGVHRTVGTPFKNMKGVNNVSSFNAGAIGGGYFISVAEHLHALFGGNNWHTSGGRGDHTFLYAPNSYSITGQSFSTMQAPCGWDRWMMNWQNPEKNFLVSALDENNNEINTENFSIENDPGGGTFILRDFMVTGDAIRIKLPHISWTKTGDVKNQYLWIENRRMNTTYDKYYSEACADNDNGKYPLGTPGIYMYLQVGKDSKEGPDIYYTSAEYPNALASFLMPVTAEGNYDFYYAWDKVQEADPGLCGNWGNSNLPVNKAKSKPNPFTGCSDLYDYVDFSNDGKLYSGDKVQPGLSEVIGDSVVHNYNSSGDWQDAFCKATGCTELSMSTNPAPVPVYTLTTNYESGTAHLPKGKYAAYENRTIFLNGLSIKILQENVFGNGEVKIKIQWNDYSVKNDVRWCGNIVLSPNDFDTLKPSLILEKKKRILVDRGHSITNFRSDGKDMDGRWLYSDTTQFTCKKNSYVQLMKGSQLVLDNGSVFMLEKGSKFEMLSKSKIILKNHSKFIVEDGAVFIKGPGCRIIKKDD